MTSTFPPIDHATWKARLQKELKNQTWDDLQWQVDDEFAVEPLYDPQQTEALGYLRNFHQIWQAQRQTTKPIILASLAGLHTATEIETAETYGFDCWVADSGTQPHKTSLPVRLRNSSCDPFFESLRYGRNMASMAVEPASSICLHASDVHQAGGSPVQEIASALLAAVWLQQHSGSMEWMKTTTIQLAAGPQFWLEMCKFRAMRLLWMNFCHANGLGRLKGNIRSTTSTFCWSRTDSDINLLRHTIETMAAILGGADELLVQPHTFEPAMALDALRLSVNIGHLALEESNLGKYHDPSAGSYMADMLTHKLADAAWRQFNSWLAIGADQVVANGTFQSDIAEQARKRKADYDAKKTTMVGVNVFPSEFARKSPPFPVNTPVENPDFQVLIPVFLDA